MQQQTRDRCYAFWEVSVFFFWRGTVAAPPMHHTPSLPRVILLWALENADENSTGINQ